jgi:hypothetical protein
MTRRDFIAVAFMLAGIYIWVAYGIYLVASIAGSFAIREGGIGVVALLEYLFGFLVACVVVLLVGHAFIFRATHSPRLST